MLFQSNAGNHVFTELNTEDKYVYQEGHVVNLIGDDIRTIGRNADVLLNASKDIGLAVNIGKTKYKKWDVIEA